MHRPVNRGRENGGGRMGKKGGRRGGGKDDGKEARKEFVHLPHIGRQERVSHNLQQ